MNERAQFVVEFSTRFAADDVASEALAGERIGLEEVDDGIWSVSLSTVLLARFHARERNLYG